VSQRLFVHALERPDLLDLFLLVLHRPVEVLALPGA